MSFPLSLSREGHGIGVSRPSILILAFSALALGICNADAILTLDVRATSATGGATVQDSKHVSLLAASAGGSTVTFSLYAVVTGAPGNTVIDEKFQSTRVSLLTYAQEPKNIRGDLASVVLDPVFAAGATTNGGGVADLNGDGDLDVGGPTAIANPGSLPYISARAASMLGGGIPGVSTDLPGDPAGREWFLGTSTLTIGDLLDETGAPIFANFVIPIYTSQLTNHARALFVADGVTGNGGHADSPNIFAGTAVTIAPLAVAPAPEPSAFGMLIAGVLAVAGKRRARTSAGGS